MNIRRPIAGIGFAAALVVPLATYAGEFFETTYDEAGSRIVAAQFGAVTKTARPSIVMSPEFGDVSADREYVYLGQESGWQLRPMQYRFVSGKFVHVDDPAGHMDRVADSRPITEQERMARERSGGN